MECYGIQISRIRSEDVQAAGAISIFFVVLAVLIILNQVPPVHAAEGKTVFYIAPAGDNEGPGTLQEPFATICRAQEAVRQLRKSQTELTTPIIIYLRGGAYSVREPVILTHEDSGSARSPVIYAAYPGEDPVITGGVEIDGWEIQDDRRWTAALPGVSRGDWYFRQLFVNGQRRPRPRIPDDGYLYIKAETESTGTHPDRFQFRAGDIKAGWHNIEDVELLIFHHWSMSRLPIAEIDRGGNTLTLRQSTWHPRHASLRSGTRYIVENVYEALEPGEWYLDRHAGKLTYVPLKGETPENTLIIAPVARQLVIFSGNPGEGLPVSHIELRGITFEHALATLPRDGYSVAQAEVGARGARGRSPLLSAVEAVGARRIKIIGCTIRHVGSYAVEFGESCHDNLLRGCVLWDLGAGGIRAGPVELYPEGDPRNSTRLTVEDCLIAHGGRMHPAGVGVWIGNSGKNRIVHNTIHDFYYSGISAGWNWDPGYSAAEQNLIAHNHIHDIGQGRLDDLGGIYTLGVSEGTVISNNRIHDISRAAYTGAGIYLDQSSSGLTIKNNLVFRTQDGALTVNNKDTGNMVYNNIFAFGEEFTLRPGCARTGGSMIFERNIVAWDTGAAYMSIEVRKDFMADRNLYWPGHGKMDNFAENRSFAEWQAGGNDRNSIFSDPGFFNPAADDFQLSNESPAPRIGFQPWALDEAGRRAPFPCINGMPAVPHAFPFARAAETESIYENFSRYQPGDAPSSVHIFENNEVEIIRVSDEIAASGGRSLEITNGPSDPSWNPHCFWPANFTGGELTAAFDLLLRPGASMVHEWRDYGPGAACRTGPSLRIEGDGRLLADGRELLKLPHGSWISFRISCRLGDVADGLWDLTVRTADGRRFRFESLSCDSAFRRLRWFGFIAAGKNTARMYLDNVGVHSRR